MSKAFKLGVLGFGNMATAILKGILSNSLMDGKDIVVSDFNVEKESVAKEMGINFSTNETVLKNSEIVLFAVKPQTFRTEIAGTIAGLDAELIISIMAGIKVEELVSSTGNENILRVMPNLPLMYGNGTSALYFNKPNKYEAFAKGIFDSIGKTIMVDETLFDAVTSVSGSGPAYVFYFIKSMIEGGMQGGMTYDEAKLLAVNTVIGSAEMLEKSPVDIDTLIKNVCSKGGTTIEAINCFENNDMNGIIKEGIERCRNRSKELSSK